MRLVDHRNQSKAGIVPRQRHLRGNKADTRRPRATSRLHGAVKALAPEMIGGTIGISYMTRHPVRLRVEFTKSKRNEKTHWQSIAIPGASARAQPLRQSPIPSFETRCRCAATPSPEGLKAATIPRAPLTSSRVIDTLPSNGPTTAPKRTAPKRAMSSVAQGYTGGRPHHPERRRGRCPDPDIPHRGMPEAFIITWGWSYGAGGGDVMMSVSHGSVVSMGGMVDTDLGKVRPVSLPSPWSVCFKDSIFAWVSPTPEERRRSLISSLDDLSRRQNGRRFYATAVAGQGMRLFDWLPLGKSYRA